MSSEGSDPAKALLASIRHWIERIFGVVAAVVLAVLVVRIATRGIRPDASVGQYFAAVLWILMLGTCVWSGIKAWRRSEPPVRNLEQKFESGEVMNLGHGDFDPVRTRRVLRKGGIGWGVGVLVGLVVFLVTPDDSRFIGLMFAVFALLLVGISGWGVVKVDRARKA